MNVHEITADYAHQVAATAAEQAAGYLASGSYSATEIGEFVANVYNAAFKKVGEASSDDRTH